MIQLNQNKSMFASERNGTMAGQIIKKVKALFQWGKILLPLNQLRYFPPRFVIRDPIAEGVKKAFKMDFETAVIVYNIKNLQELSDQLGETEYVRFISLMKKTFQKVIAQEVNDDLIALHDYYSDGLALFIRVNHNIHSVSDIDSTMKKILRESEKMMFPELGQIKPKFETGYMFIQRKHYSIQESIYKAHQQAVAMAEKRVKTEFNEMVYSISKIISQKDIHILAQPIITLATGEVRAWEMLTRGPKGTTLENPLQLFSVARQTGMLYNLEMIVFEKILQQIIATGCTQEIFINFTPITLGNQRFVRDIKETLQRHSEISPKQMIFEITERDSIEGMDHFIYNIKVLRTLGFRIAIDDTGAGYASLNSISEILPDIIKIDRAVIQDIDKNTVKESLLKGLLLVAKETGSIVVAEGIESKEEESVLARNKVDLAQGYLYARPGVLNRSLEIAMD